jgi:hypothetical protein
MAQFPNSTGPNSGVWTLEDVYDARIGGNWPDATLNRGIFSGGGSPTLTNIMDYVAISSTGNAIDFGNLDADLSACASVSSQTRGVVGGGGSSGGAGVNTLQYVTIASTGDTTDFGDLNSNARVTSSAGLSNSTRGLFAGGEGAAPGYPTTNVIDYITIATTSNATDFGDLAANGYTLGGTASGTRGVFAGGTPGVSNVIQYVTIASTGNTTDFGDLSVARRRIGSGVQSSGTRGIFSGGETPTATNIIDYITIASTGNATDFGDLTNTTSSTCGTTSSTTRALTSAMSTSTNTIDFVTMASTSNATDFGDLTVGRTFVTGMSSAHGGLQ